MFFDDYLEPPKQRARKYEGLLKRIEYAPVERTFVNPWSLPVASEVVFDTECFKNYFYVRVQASSDAIVLLLRKDGRSPASD
jgi:hypothetical protein